MNIKYCENYNQISQLAHDSIVSDLKKNPKQLLCLATGNSPTGLYKHISSTYKAQPQYFKDFNIIKLDEWGGLEMTNPSSCEFYLQEHILNPLEVSNDRFISFKSNATDPKKECKRIQTEIEKKGPIDICVLGIGVNGHIGFNEPADSLSANCHVAQLAQTSMQHQMVDHIKDKPCYGITLGMGDILQSKKIILLITGANKQPITEQLLTKKITTQLPASLLWLHPNVECYIDSESVKK